MKETLKGAPKVKTSESVVRKTDLSDGDWFRRKLAAEGSYTEIERDYGDKGGNPFIPDICDWDPQDGVGCDFNNDFNNDFYVCNGECGSFSDEFNGSFDNCDGEGGSSSSTGSFNIAFSRSSYDVNA